METISSPPVDLFYCCASKDLELLEELKKHLASLRDSGCIASEEEASAGDSQDDIKKLLESVHVILLLVSPDFNNSPSCRSQAKWAMERLNRKEKEAVLVIPVLLCPADVSHASFSHLEMLPSNGRPVTLWDNRDNAFRDIAMGIGKSVKKLQNRLRKAPGKQKEEGYVLTQTSQRRESDFVRASGPEPNTELSGSPVLVSSRATLNGPVSLPPTRITKDKNKGRITKHKNKRWIVLTASILLLVLLGAIFVPKLLPSTSTKIVGLSTSVTPMGELVGISDGRFAFDIDTTNRVDGPDKMQAANAFASGDTAYPR